jgi:hypothetical protein
VGVKGREVERRWESWEREERGRRREGEGRSMSDSALPVELRGATERDGDGGVDLGKVGRWGAG